MRQSEVFLHKRIIDDINDIPNEQTNLAASWEDYELFPRTIDVTEEVKSEETELT